MADRRALNQCPSFLVRPALPARYETVEALENQELSCLITPIAALTSSHNNPEGSYSLIREIFGVEEKSCIKDCREEERGCSREGATIDLILSLDRRHFVEARASVVGEAGREDPMVGSGEEEATEEMLVAGGKNEVMGAEGNN